ncbi:mitochondrial potassium channel-like [Musca vetustissima]|uniref:mitochondrial potassium channel-like n=1 Tax=Musca vetustissima TaxID=27455 RepID=UPI002AB763D6|nr:mitochondrial potassium channel-like [Musca vetustissima]
MIRTLICRRNIYNSKVHKISYYETTFGVRRAVSLYQSTTSGNESKGDEEKLLKRLVTYVEKATYMEEVRISQAHVMSIKGQLLAAGEEKRSLMRKLEDIRNELNHIYKDMKINRTKETYLELARQEIELCESEKHYSDLYKLADKKEQLLFTEFSAAINASYEKEKLHTNFIKIMSIVGTVASSFIALIFSIFMHTYHQKMFFSQRTLDENAVNTVKALEEKVSDLLIEWNHQKTLMESSRKEEQESWSSYLYRHTRWMYSWAMKSS